MGAATDSQSTESREFLRRRVGRFGLVGGGLGLGFWLFRVAGSLSFGQPGYALTPGMVFHLCGALALLAVWAAVRWVGAPGAVRRVEVAGLLVSSVAYQLMGAHLELIVLRPDLTATLALTYALIARAVFVPSSARRTLLLTGAIGIPHLLILYVFDRPQQIFEAARLEALPTPFPVAMRASDFLTYAILENAAWWTATTLLCGAISQVLYGLREQVRAARRLGQYVLEEKLGEGGMGAVYRASHTLLRRPTAVKLLPPEKAGEEAIARFEREVRLAARLTHPNTVTIFDYGRSPGGVFYYAMELLDGADLQEVVAVDGPQSAERVVHVLVQVAGSLAEAHAAGLIHRDVKPANVILCERGGVPDVAKVVDFGLARPLDDGDIRLTAASSLTGTPLYMSPEAIAEPDRVDERSDLYALGAVAWFLLAGENVFGGRTAVEVCSHHLHTPPRSLVERTRGRVPVSLDALILACLAKRPEERPASALELRERLRACAVDPWTESAAREWWEAHGEALLSRRRRAAPSPGLTLAVDLGLRRRAGVDSGTPTRLR